MEKKIAVLPGDGIGEEVMAEAIRVLRAVGEKFGHVFHFEHALVGGAAYDKHQNHFPDVTKEVCRRSEAIFFGSVGGPVSEQHLPKWKSCEAASLLSIRKAFSFNANFRPIKVFPELASISPLRAEVINAGVDLLFIRELNGDIYFGEKKSFLRDGRRVATDVAEYTEDQVAAVAHTAFKAARLRRKKVTSVDKANVLEVSRLWRAVVKEISAEYPDIELEDMLVDNCAMQLIRNPAQFDVVLTGNMFGDILSDAAAVLPGSLGMLASASMNREGFGMFEPPGGSAQDIAGKGIANPIAQILSGAMMLRFAFAMEKEAELIESSVNKAIAAGYRTGDILPSSRTDQGSDHGKLSEKLKKVGTREMTDAVLAGMA